MTTHKGLDHVNIRWADTLSARSYVESRWMEEAAFVVPRRYRALTSNRDYASRFGHIHIVDGTGTWAARVLAAGMFTGVTSPARPWIGVRDEEREWEDLSQEEQEWYQHVTQVILTVMDRSNYYNAKAVQWLDNGVFGTTPMIIYDDPRDVIRCYVSPVGEFALDNNDAMRVDFFSRKISRTYRQVRLMLENKAMKANKDGLPPATLSQLEDSGSAKTTQDFIHCIEPNTDGLFPEIPASFKWRDVYWAGGSAKPVPFIAKGFHEQPFSVMRWNVLGNDVYATGVIDDCLGDIKQLQSETLSKGKGLARQVEPPMQADGSLENKVVSLAPRAINFVPGLAQGRFGMAPIYSPNFTLNDVTNDISMVQERIQRMCYNDLFRGVSNLQTVRSATEVDVRESEKLLSLGQVLKRNENEAFDVEVARIYAICKRRGLFRQPPASMQERGARVGVRYRGLLAEAQSATGLSQIERYLQIAAQSASVWPDAAHVPNIPVLLREYGERLAVPSKGMNAVEDIEARTAQDKEDQQLREVAELGPGVAQAAANLSQTDVGGGVDASLGGLLG